MLFSSNHACRAELGRFPICFKMWKLCLQYWLRLENGTDNIRHTNVIKKKIITGIKV